MKQYLIYRIVGLVIFINICLLAYDDSINGYVNKINLYLIYVLILVVFLFELIYQKLVYDIKTISLTCVLLLYIILVAFITSDADPVGLMLSKNGLFFWFFLGITLSVCHKLNIKTKKIDNFITYFFLLVLAILLLDGLKLGNLKSENYQSTGYLIASCLIIAYLNQCDVFRKQYFYNITITMVIGIIMFLTGSVFVFALGIGLIILQILDSKDLLSKNTVLALLVVILILNIVLQNSAGYFEGTRFDGAKNILEITSLNSRIETLEGIIKQIDTGFLFGDFESHIQSGYNIGNFVHSFYLSLLTDAGLISFVAFNVIIIRQYIYLRNEKLKRNLYLSILFLCSISVHLSNFIFWFLVGYMTVRSKKYEFEK